MARKFSDEDLINLIRQGKTQSEAARILGVRDSSICKRLKRINISLSRDIGLFSARRVMDRHLSISDIVDGIKRQASEVMELINVVINGEHLPDYWPARQKLARLIPAKGGIGNLMVAQQAELRKAAEFELNIQSKLFDIKEVRDFQETVLKTINEADPETAMRIKRRLVEMNAVRSVLDFQPGLPEREVRA